GQLDSLLTELNTFSQMINSPNGTIQKFASDPQLYDNLNRSAAALTLLMRHIEPTLADFRIFADRIARHPEVLGVSGAIKGSTGVKEAANNAVQQAAGSVRVTQ
ncbi:MAG TPA: MCE family protein, partial [Caulifigura sp.]|nr:MCE family protein [Caulifigura sp.]